MCTVEFFIPLYIVRGNNLYRRIILPNLHIVQCLGFSKNPSRFSIPDFKSNIFHKEQQNLEHVHKKCMDNFPTNWTEPWFLFILLLAPSGALYIPCTNLLKAATFFVFTQPNMSTGVTSSHFYSINETSVRETWFSKLEFFTHRRERNIFLL